MSAINSATITALYLFDAAERIDLASRLGLAPWKASVEEKLTTLNNIYRFAVGQVSITRGHFLELMIIVILVFELVLVFMGILT